MKSWRIAERWETTTIQAIFMLSLVLFEALLEVTRLSLMSPSSVQLEDSSGVTILVVGTQTGNIYILINGFLMCTKVGAYGGRGVKLVLYV
jgi:hypothetical protein